MEIIIFIVVIITLFAIKFWFDRERFRRALLNQKPCMYWDAAPKCPYCGKQQEAAFGLEEDGEWFDLTCLGCRHIFWIEPKFELSCEVVKEVQK